MQEARGGHGALGGAGVWTHTALFEALVIDGLKEASISAVLRLMGLSWNAINGMMQRAVRRGLDLYPGGITR